jgi:hypothetical protein
MHKTDYVGGRGDTDASFVPALEWTSAVAMHWVMYPFASFQDLRHYRLNTHDKSHAVMSERLHFKHGQDQKATP